MSQIPEWGGGNSIVSQVESVLNAAQGIEFSDSRSWEATAEQKLSDINPDLILDAAHGIVADFNYTFLADTCQALQGCIQPTQEDVRPLRRARKHLLIARDSLMLTSAASLKESHESLFRLCFALGRVADTCAEQKIPLVETVDEAKNMLEISIQSYQLRPSSTRDVHEKILQTLKRHSIDTPGRIDPDELHNNRKAFRRIVHLSLLHAVVQPSDLGVEFAMKGLAINRMYGERHTSLVKEMSEEA